MRLFVSSAAVVRVTSGGFASESNFCSGLISKSEPCSILLLRRLGERDGCRLLEAPLSGATEAGAAADTEGVVERLLGVLLGLRPPFMPPPLIDLSSFQALGPRSLGSSLAKIAGLGEGVRAGDEPGMRLASSFRTGLSGGVGSGSSSTTIGSSSASKGSCISVSGFSWSSIASSKTLFFRYSGPKD